MKLTESRLRSIIRSVIAEEHERNEHGYDEHGYDEHGYKSFAVPPEDRRDLEASLRAAEGPGEPEEKRAQREERKAAEIARIEAEMKELQARLAKLEVERS